MIIETKYGKMEGVDKGSYIEYRGVPYAKPPVGDLRWRAPQEPDAWDGIYRAVDFKNRCVQEDHLAPPYDQDFYSNPDFARPDDEDCLYLQIWVPKSGRKHAEGTISGIHKNEADSPETAERPRQKKLPVAFWIHGSAFLGGFSSELEFDVKAYCDRGVILVSVE